MYCDACEQLSHTHTFLIFENYLIAFILTKFPTTFNVTMHCCQFYIRQHSTHVVQQWCHDTLLILILLHSYGLTDTIFIIQLYNSISVFLGVVCCMTTGEMELNPALSITFLGVVLHFISHPNTNGIKIADSLGHCSLIIIFAYFGFAHVSVYCMLPLPGQGNAGEK